MKSLEERKAARAKQKEEEKLERKGNPDQNFGADKYEKGEEPQDEDEKKQASSSSASFDAGSYLNGNVQTVSDGLAQLSPEQLDAVEQAEKSGKNRAGVNDAISTEKKKRESAAASWGSNR